MKVTALELRHRLGEVLETLDREQVPIIIEKGRKPRAVLIPLRLYRERFVDLQEKELREQLVREFRDHPVPVVRDTIAELRRLRYGDKED